MIEGEVQNTDNVVLIKAQKIFPLISDSCWLGIARCSLRFSLTKVGIPCGSASHQSLDSAGDGLIVPRLTRRRGASMSVSVR